MKRFQRLLVIPVTLDADDPAIHQGAMLCRANGAEMTIFWRHPLYDTFFTPQKRKEMLLLLLHFMRLLPAVLFQDLLSCSLKEAIK